MQKSKKETLPLQDLPKSIISFFISRIEEENQLWQTAYRPNYQKILWVEKGQGQHLIDDKLIDIKRNTFYFINKGKVYQLQKEGHIDGVLIRYSNEFLPPINQNFNDKFYSSLYGYISDVGHFQLDEQVEVHEYLTIINQLINESQRPPEIFGKRNILQHLLLTVLLMLERKSREVFTKKVANTGKKDKEVYYQFLELMELNFFKEHHVEFYARHLGIRRRRLSEIIKLFHGQPAKKILQDRIILESKRLLTFTNSNLKDIAYQLGFDTPTYFSRYFKKHTQQTPLEYQKQREKKRS